MAYKKVLSIQDISCVGQCSLTVALPVLSAAGMETCILPSAVLSTHTAREFGEFTFRDLTEDLHGIIEHWKDYGLKFDTIYTGYLGSIPQIRIVQEVIRDLGTEDCTVVIDPAMADNGELYTGFDQSFVDAMKELVPVSDYILPNLTEACLLTDTPYREDYDEAFVELLADKLKAMGANEVVLTGVSYDSSYTGVVVSGKTDSYYYKHKNLSRSSHGTGDVYASAFVASLCNDKEPKEAIQIAADYTCRCIENTMDDPTHWYGVKFETAIPYLLSLLGLA